jgi:hypothetical protein
MTDKTRILFLSANPWTTSRILVDEEAREIFERLREGPYRDHFELQKHTATRPIDLQKLLLLYEPHIVHFSGHGSKREKLILGSTPGRGKTVDRDGLASVFALYKEHLQLVFLNACFTQEQARSICKGIDYSIGTGRGIGDKGGVAFAGAFYRALGFGKSIKTAFESAKAELGLTKVPRTQGIELYVREGLDETDSLPHFARDVAVGPSRQTTSALGQFRDGSKASENSHGIRNSEVVVTMTEETVESQIMVDGVSRLSLLRKRVRSEVTVYRKRERDGERG